MKIGKGAFYRQIDMDLKRAYDYAAHIMTENMQATRRARKGIDAFLQQAQACLAGLLEGYARNGNRVDARERLVVKLLKSEALAFQT